MDADNQGEGGIFALLALIHARSTESGQSASRRGLGPIVVMILIGAALLYGDGITAPPRVLMRSIPHSPPMCRFSPASSSRPYSGSSTREPVA
jgi:hypothetical protein